MNPLDAQREAIRSQRERQPLRDSVYRGLREAIFSGHYRQGQRLTELEVAADLGVSRTPVREAFRKLELEGLVQNESGKGITVTYLTTEDMLEVYSLMVALEGMVARLAAERVDAESCRLLHELLSALEEAQNNGDAELSAERHTALNQQIFVMSGNRRLQELLALYNNYVTMVQASSWEGRLWQVQEEHRALVGAICRGDGLAAEQIMRTHVEHSRGAYVGRIQGGDADDQPAR